MVKKIVVLFLLWWKVCLLFGQFHVFAARGSVKVGANIQTTICDVNKNKCRFFLLKLELKHEFDIIFIFQNRQIVKFFQEGTKIGTGDWVGIPGLYKNVMNHFVKRTKKIYHNKFIPFNSGGLVIGLGVRRYVYTVEEYKKDFSYLTKFFLFTWRGKSKSFHYLSITSSSWHEKRCKMF